MLLRLAGASAVALAALVVATPAAGADPVGDAELPPNPLVRDVYTADPAARVFGDRLYVYTSHDESDATYFDMVDWRLYSTADMRTWTDHGTVVRLEDFDWAEKWAWAPDCVERDGAYYFYAPIGRDKIGVAVADAPTGPFRDALGRPLIDKATMPGAGREPIDPAVLIDDDDLAYLYFGARDLRVARLREDMVSIDGPLLSVEIRGVDGRNKEGQLGFYGEGPWCFKRGGKVYLMFSNGWAKRSTLVYAIGESPLGPFDFAGEVMAPVDCWTSHGSIVEFQDQWYVFYHTMTLSKNNYRRSVCVDRLEFDSDGRIVRREGTLGPRVKSAESPTQTR